MSNDRVLEITKEHVSKVMSLLGLENEVKYEVEETEGICIIKVSIEGEDLGYMIGNRGSHLQSLQYVLSLGVKTTSKKEDPEKKIGIYLDVSGYRSQRIEQVERMAMQKADDARILGEAVDLPPMSAGDRRVVHAVLSKFDDISTESFGEDSERYVRITPLTDDEIGVSSSDDDNEIEETQE